MQRLYPLFYKAFRGFSKEECKLSKNSVAFCILLYNPLFSDKFADCKIKDLHNVGYTRTLPLRPSGPEGEGTCKHIIGVCYQQLFHHSFYTTRTCHTRHP